MKSVKFEINNSIKFKEKQSKTLRMYCILHVNFPSISEKKPHDNSEDFTRAEK